MIRSQSVWVARGDTSLAGLNASFKEWVIAPGQLLDLEPQRHGADWTILQVRFETTVVPALLTTTIHQGAWFLPAYQPARIVLLFNTPIAKSSIVNGTFKLVYADSEADVLAADVAVDGEMLTIELDYPVSYTGPVTLLGSGFESESGGDAGDAVNLQFSIVDANHIPSFTPANHGQASSSYRYGVVRAGRVMVPFGAKPETMLKNFLTARSIAPSQVIKTVYRGSAVAGFTDLYVVWYPLMGIRVVAASPAAWLPSEAAVDRILVNFDQPVDLTADEITVTGPSGVVSVTPTAMDARKTQWKITGAFTSPGQYDVILDSVKNLAGDSVPFRHAFGWQVMPTEVTGTGGGVTDHGALTGLADDDHTQYQLRTEKDAASGYAALDSSSKVVKDPASAATTAAANAIPKANGSGKIDTAFLKTGTGNGLDADTVDGQHASAFEASGAAASAITAHLAASDPHTAYQRESEKDAASGYAGLDANSRVTKEVMLIQLGTVAARPSGSQGGQLYFASDAVYNTFTGRLQVWIP